MKSFALVWMLVGIACWGQVPQSKHVWLITEENHSYESVVGNASMPYYNALAAQYGLAAQYYANQHNSLSALMWLVAGQPVTTDADASSCFNVNNLVRGMVAQGLSWKSYQVDLPYAGFQGLSWLNYVRRHNPLIDFTETCSGTQALDSVPFSQLAIDIANNATPNFSYISPNVAEDAHDGTLSDADQWLAQQVPAILERPEFVPGGDGVLFIVWDEGGLSGDNRCSAKVSFECGGRVATLVIGPQVRPHYQSSVRYDHANLLRTVCDAMGISSCPGEAALASPMSDFFNTVRVIYPQPDGRVSSPVRIQAVTNNDSPITAIQAYVDDSLAYQSSSSSVNTVLPMTPGKHHVVLQSWDAAGGIHKSGVEITVQLQAVELNSPMADAAMSSPVPITATGGGKSPVHTIQIYVDDVLQYSVNSNNVDTSLEMGPGNHHVVAQAWDDSGGITKNGAYINVVAAPTVMVLRPGPSAKMYSPVPVQALTQDANPVYAMQVYVDDALRYEFSGNGLQFPLSMPPGNHSLVVQAWDTAGGIYKNRETITVQPVIVKISSPSAKTTLRSPVTVTASVPSNSPVYTMQVFVDSVLQYQVNGKIVSKALTIGSGPHSITVQAWDSGGGTWKTNLPVEVQ